MGGQIRGAVRSPNSFARSVSSFSADLLDGRLGGKRHLSGYSSWRWYRRALLAGFLPLLFLLASCSGGDGGGSGSDSSLRAELTFTSYADAVFITLNNNSGNLADVVDLTIRALDENGEQVSNVTLRIEDLVRGHNYTIPDGTYLFELIATVRTDTDSFTSRKIRIDYRGVRLDARGRIIVGEVSEGGSGNGGDGGSDNGSGGGDGSGSDPGAGSDNNSGGGDGPGDGDGPGGDPGDGSGSDPGDGDGNDLDGDRVVNSDDVDDDGDGLIEIATAEELNAVRYALNGSGRRLSETGELSSIGCGNGADITSCRGYELVANISLVDYTAGDGWEPLGKDTDSSTNGCQGTAFDGIFDGNGFTVSNLSISRSGEDCIGLFGHLAAGSVIRDLRVKTSEVSGRGYVAGLVGEADNAKIVSSSVVAGLVRGEGNHIAGLVGRADNAKIVSSSVIAGEIGSVDIFGSSAAGGLVGQAINTKITSSLSVSGEIRGGDQIAGLIGSAVNTDIVSSYSVTGGAASDLGTGGLIGNSVRANITSSFSVAGEISRNDGEAVLGGLVGGGGGNIDYSYWYVAAAFTATNSRGESKTLSELRTPTSYGGIYANWADGANIDGVAGVEDITIYCDEDLSGAIEANEMRDGSGSGDDNRIWDFGEMNDYPAIRCAPLSLTEQRSWWFINAMGHPNVNQTRLDALFP